MRAWLAETSGWLFAPGGLTPHGFCLSWEPGLIWLHAVSDGLIGLAYYSIPLTLVWYITRRRDVSFGWIYALFAAFILACGTTHWLSILTLFVPAYGTEGLVKAFTALVSVTTAVALWPLVPKALALPSRADLDRVGAALRSNQRFLQRTGAVAGVGGWEIDLASGTIHWSDLTCQMHGVAPGYVPTLEEAIGYCAAEHQPAVRAAITACVEGGRPWDLEIPMVSKGGRPFWANVVGALESEDGKPVRLVGAIQEITTRKGMERELASEREMLQVTLEAIGAAVGDAVITTDLAGQVKWLNSVAERLTGWTREAALGEHVARVFAAVTEGGRVAIDDPVTLSLTRPGAAARREPALLLSRDGREYGIEDSAAVIRDARGQPIGAVLVFRDVSEQRRLNAEMRHRATHDALTGLSNRAEFEAALAQMLATLQAHGGHHALMYIDLDQFKLVNDTCGHAVGDQLLKQVGALLRSAVRGHDIVARLGGDEFGVILRDCPLEEAQRVGNGICRRMEEFRFLHGGRRFQVGASIGLVPVDGRWEDAGAVMRAADTSCYGAKDAGRSRVHVWFESDHLTNVRNRDMDWVSRFSEALDDDLFVLHGQIIRPLAPASPGLRFETLLRLRGADGTLADPAAFMPAAERFNMATRIDRWVVRKVLAWMEHLGAHAERIAMATINLSGQSIGDREFQSDIAAMIDAAHFDRQKLCFEITETAAITNYADAGCFIREMRAMGIRIALDDFGSGAASFGYLKMLPVDYLKIDGQFIVNLLEDELDRATVRCFHGIAGVIGVKTIAESVESQDVQDALQEIGIDMVQGYLVHRPEPLDAILWRDLLSPPYSAQKEELLF
jgi:diguanylate cyclase (GGDEF)-like protein/PAS domain S-box-containing protein